MELRSRVLAEVEPGDLSPEGPGPSTLETEGSGELVPVSFTSNSCTTDIAGASHSHPYAAGLMGATLKALIASSPQMSGLVGTTSNPDVETNSKSGLR